MSVSVNTSTNNVTVQNTHQTITIVDNNTSNIVNIDQPLVNVVEVATPGPQGSPAPFINLGNNIWSANSNLQITGSTSHSGSIFMEGDIIPTISSSFSLGSMGNPWKDIFLQSGSISIRSDMPGAPDTLISNIDGNLLISAGGMQLLGSASFRAATGSFGYISGSLTQVGNYTQEGSFTRIGTSQKVGNEQITGSLGISGSITLSPGSPLNINDGFYVNGNKQFNYGAFSDTTSQSGSANTAYPMTFNTNDIAGLGVNIVSQSRITVDNTGIYNLQFSAQLDRVAGSGNAIVSIWLRVTGSNVANSGGDVALTGNAASSAVIAAWNYVLPISASQYCELIWSTTDQNIHIAAINSRTNPVRPAVPSVIATLTQVA